MLWRKSIMKMFGVAAFLAIAMMTAIGQPSVSVSPATKNALPSSSFSLSFNIANVINLHGYHVIVDYDNAILQYDGATPGTFINSFLFFPTVVGPHTVDVGHALIGSGTVVSGSGLLFTMQFTGIGSGTSSVTITSVDLRDGSNNGITPVTINSGSVTVGNPDVVYVNSTYSAGNAGGHDFGYDAFNAVANGVSAVNAGGTVNIAAATYNESVGITKDMTLTGSGNPTIQNLTVNTPAVTIGGNIQVSNVLTLTSGVVTTGSNTITITNDQPGGVVISNGSITGEICRMIATGNTGEYLCTNKFTKIKPDPAQPTTTVCVKSYPNTYPPAAPAGTAINRYYTITASPTNFSAEGLWMEFLPAENINSIPRPSWSIFRRVGGNPWESVGGVPDFTNYFVFGGPFNSWSDWAIGNAINPLPIQLSSFTGRVVNGRDVKLDWTTLSEINNYGFEIQKSATAAAHFQTIENSFVAGNGTTNVPHYYSFIEHSPANGNWYYRLKQIDLDGDVHFTEPIHLDVLTGINGNSTPTAFVFNQNYPNPFNPSTTLSFEIPQQTHVTLEVYNVLGEKIETLISQELEAGRHAIEWTPENIASGVYLAHLSAGSFVSIRKVLLNK